MDFPMFLGILALSPTSWSDFPRLLVFGVIPIIESKHRQTENDVSQMHAGGWNARGNGDRYFALNCSALEHPLPLHPRETRLGALARLRV